MRKPWQNQPQNTDVVLGNLQFPLSWQAAAWVAVAPPTLMVLFGIRTDCTVRLLRRYRPTLMILIYAENILERTLAEQRLVECLVTCHGFPAMCINRPTVCCILGLSCIFSCPVISILEMCFIKLVFFCYFGIKITFIFLKPLYFLKHIVYLLWSQEFFPKIFWPWRGQQ